MNVPSNDVQVKDPRFTSTLGGGAKKAMPALDLSKISFPPRNIPRPQGPSPMKTNSGVGNPLQIQSGNLGNVAPPSLAKKESMYDINPIGSGAIRPSSTTNQ